MTFALDWNEKELSRAVVAACEGAIGDGAEEVLKEAQANCPVGTVERGGSGYKPRKPGSLAKSGRVVPFSKPDVVGAYVKFGGRGHMVDDVDTYYAPFVELGTPGTVFKSKNRKGPRIAVKAKPFLRPALKKQKRRILAAFKNRLK